MVPLPPSDALEAALRAALPPKYNARAAELARALLAASARSDDAYPVPDPTLQPLLSALAGTKLQAGHTVVSFDGAQLGDVTFQGDIAGRDIIKVTLNVLPPTASLSPQERRNRERMLQKVRNFWVKGVLERSLYREALLALGMELRPGAVTNPWTLLVAESDPTPQPLPPGTTITDVFDEAGGELLILGAPGAGKTTTLLELTRVLLDRAEQDLGAPMPVVFNLASWTARRPPLTQWLVDELNARYDVPRALGEMWIATDHVLPLLDGLDEVRAAEREACLMAINTFRAVHGMVGIVVCSRLADYEVLTGQLRARSAILIQPLTPVQTDSYLVAAGPSLADLRSAIQRDPSLSELAESPLMLSTMMLVAQDNKVDWLYKGVGTDERRRQLFEATKP